MLEQPLFQPQHLNRERFYSLVIVVYPLSCSPVFASTCGLCRDLPPVVNLKNICEKYDAEMVQNHSR